jgi:hypothetical protein
MLEEIGITIEQVPLGGEVAGPSASAVAILHEVETSLEALLNSGESHEIDLRRLPLAVGDLLRIPVRRLPS